MTATTATRSDEPRNKLRVELLHPTTQQESVSRRYRSVRHCPKHPTSTILGLPAYKGLMIRFRIHIKKEVKCPIQLMNP
jgi:hypothetical protein